MLINNNASEFNFAIYTKALKKSTKNIKKNKQLTFLFPTSMIGTFGQKCLTSGVHFSGIFSKLSGLSILKHINMTSVSGYDKGLKRS